MDYWCIGVAVGGMVLMAILVYFGYRMEKKRTEGFRQFAEELGFAFAPKPPESFLARFSKLPLFTQGGSRAAANLMTGTAGGLDVAIFDYSYVTGSGKSRTTWRQTVLAFTVEDIDLPDFSMRPEHFFHRIGQWFGFHDIDFDTHPTFSKSYLLRGQNEEAIRGLFQEHVLDHFETVKGVCVEGSRNCFVYYRAQKKVDPEQVRPFMEEGFQVLGLFR